MSGWIQLAFLTDAFSLAAGRLPEHDDSYLHLLLVIPDATLQKDYTLLCTPTPRKNGQWARVSLVYLEDWYPGHWRAALMTETRENEGKTSS